jgi:hypothetical protein
LGNCSISQQRDQIAGDLDTGEITGGIVRQHRKLNRTAEPHEVGVDRLDRWRPKIWRDGEDAVGADVLSVPRQCHRVLDGQCAHMNGDRNAPVHDAHRGFGEELSLRYRQIERLALMVRPGNGGCAGTHVKVQQPFECREVEAEVILERRHRLCMTPLNFVVIGSVPIAAERDGGGAQVAAFGREGQACAPTACGRRGQGAV